MLVILFCVKLVVVGKQLGRDVACQASVVRAYRDERVLGLHRGFGRKHLGHSDAVVGVDDLALEVRILDRVVIDHTDGTDTRSGQVLKRGRTKPPCPDDKDARFFQAVLAGAADFAQDDVAGVAFQFGGAGRGFDGSQWSRARSGRA